MLKLTNKINAYHTGETITAVARACWTATKLVPKQEERLRITPKRILLFKAGCQKFEKTARAIT